MYSLALLTFDSDFSVSYSDLGRYREQRIRKRKRLLDGNVQETLHDDLPELTDEEYTSAVTLWSLHVSTLKAFREIDPTSYEKENYAQFAIYFEMMQAIPNCKQLVIDMLGYVPVLSGPGGNVPSRLHSNIVRAMSDNLATKTKEFEIVNEFNGLNGVFPVDVALYAKDQLISLIEIDGEMFHYDSRENLNRKDQLKQFCYKVKYPDIPFIRIRSDKVNAITVPALGKSLAGWILSKMKIDDLKEEVDLSLFDV